VVNLVDLCAELGLPERAEQESTYMNALRLALPRACPVKLFRQMPGFHEMKRGGAVHGAPKGAADLTGWIVAPHPMRGLRVEIECKYGAGRTRPEQRAWLAVCAADGVVALVLTCDPALTLVANLHIAVEAVHAALRAREGGA
jgi:hypothetical protein